MVKVLIVEDNRSFRESLRESLDHNFPDMAIGEAVNCMEALEKVDSFHPGLVFMDIRLPDGSGLELTRKIKARFPEVAVVMLSGHHIPEYREAAIRCGASDFITKDSLSHAQLDALVKSLC